MTGLTNAGEQWILKHTFIDGTDNRPASMNIGLYDDATAQAGDATLLSSVRNNEPDGGGGGTEYARQSVDFSTDMTLSDTGGGTFTVDITDQTFQLGDISSGTVDAYYLSANVDLGGGSQEHLILTGALNGTYELGNYSQFTIQDAGLTLD